MGFFAKLSAFFKVFFNSVFGQVALQALVPLIADFGKSAVDELVRKGKDRAIRIEQEFPNGSSDLKRKQLTNYLGDVGTGLGLSLAASVVNILVEVIVNALKNEGKL